MTPPVGALEEPVRSAAPRAAALETTTPVPAVGGAPDVLDLQRSAGNQAVNRALQEQEPDDSVAEPIMFRSGRETHKVYLAGPPGREEVVIASNPQLLRSLLRNHLATERPYYTWHGLIGDLEAAIADCTKIASMRIMRKNKRGPTYEQDLQTLWDGLNQRLLRLAPSLLWGQDQWYVDWIKPAIDNYPPIFIGPRSANSISQQTLAEYREWRFSERLLAIRQQLTHQEWSAWAGAETAFKWDRYWGREAEMTDEPFGPVPDRWPSVSRYRAVDHGSRLPNGTQIGVDPEYQIWQGKTFEVPSEPGQTEGGTLINDALKPFGFSAGDEGLDGDHLKERQLDGPNELANLWPLEAAANRSGGIWLSTADVYDQFRHSMPFPVLCHLAANTTDKLSLTVNIVSNWVSPRTRWR
jgi:hypothetical protein